MTQLSEYYDGTHLLNSIYKRLDKEALLDAMLNGNHEDALIEKLSGNASKAARSVLFAISISSVRSLVPRALNMIIGSSRAGTCASAEDSAARVRKSVGCAPSLRTRSAIR
jgi:hypothetical protein